MASSVKADWFVGDFTSEDEPDPFSETAADLGTPIDLEDEEAVLEARLRRLLRREGNLLDSGISCSIKSSAHTCCHACPISKAQSRQDAIGALCRLGREQEQVLTSLMALRLGDERQAV